MSWIERQLGQMPDPEIVLHIGAGSCSELPDYRRVAPERIVLVEPNPESCAELRARATGWDNVTVLQAAVAEHTGSASLRLFNFPELDSLREPVGLYSLLPGLCQVGRVEVPALTAGQLIAQLSLNADGRNWLVLEAPGEELAIITALAEAQALESFSRLIVRAGSEAFYDGTPSSSPAVLEVLEQLGYTSDVRADQSDADWPRHHLRLDRMALECSRLKGELTEYQQVEAEYKADLQSIEKALASVQQVLAESERQHQAQLAAAQKAKEKSDQAHKAELEAVKKRLAEVEQSHEAEVTATRSELEKAKVTAEETKRRYKAQLEEARKAQKEADEAHQQAIAQQTKTLTEKSTEAGKLREECDQLRSKLTAADNEVSSTRKKNDELQQKYRKLEEEYRRKEELIDEEFLKAESQLELIKELVFRDKPV